ncbi:hypothetical protein DFH11DRAFT_1690460 [Phellopilus nigrolimitatus]|nr:hypothetical protein DFH11DRAFT_1690460 [Phellopilus nigrolimitatus]
MKSFTKSITLLLSLAGLGLSAPRPHVYAAHQQQRALGIKRRDLQDNLFPSFHTYSSGFTTADGISVSGVSTVDLSDKALNVIKVQSGMTHNVVTQNGKTAWEAVYPQGSWNPSQHSARRLRLLPCAVAGGANEIVFGYSVMFQDGFEFNKGGKLPGAFGGDGDSAFGCSGGRQDARSKCFDGRLMWRTNGTGELYTYLPLTDANAAAQLAVPGTIANSDYGYSVGRGAYSFPTNEWVTVMERVKLNTANQTDGEIKLWVNGQAVISLTNVSLREDAGATIQGMQFQTFFGGSTSDWASPQTQKAWFADVSGAVVVS